MKTPDDAMKVVNNQSGFFIQKLKSFFLFRCIISCCLDKNDFWVFERAPEPSDVFWENLGTSTLSRVCRTMMSWLATLILITGGVIVIFIIKE
jgi:hypothetical protein